MNYFSFYKDGKAVYCLIFTGFLLFFPPSFAKTSVRNSKPLIQQHQIQGTVTDGNSPLPGVAIAVKGNSKTAVISDYNGEYNISASSQDTLIVSYLGFKTVLISIKNRSKIDITLEYDTTTLQEVKVNAGYYSVKESERTGSIARITSKEIESQPVTNVLATMQGRMAGVSIVQDSGTPGSGFTIRIRGQNSLRGNANEPLYIIDGVPFSSESVGYSNTSTATAGETSPLNSIVPSDIESIEVLKDADATSIYGSRGANGVVLITTKRGKQGKTTFTINSNTGVGKATRFLDLMDTQQYIAMRRQAFTNDGITNYPANAYDINGTWSQNRSTDWQKELLGGTSEILFLQGSVSGGSEKTQYLLSGNYRSETTVMPGDFKYIKGGAHFTMNHISQDDKFRLNFSSSYTIQNNNLPSIDLTIQARTLAPNAPSLYKENGVLNWENNSWTNPLAALNQTFVSKSANSVSNVLLSYRILPDLELKGSFGFTNLKNDEKRAVPSTIYNPSLAITSAASRLYTNNTARQSYIVEPQLNYKKNFGLHFIDALIGGTAQSTTTTRLYQLGANFSSNSLLNDLASAAQRLVYTSDEILYRYQAFFGRLNYNYDGTYILNLTARRDGSSRFGPGKQFATFGAVGAAWIFSREAFLRNNSILSFGKLRGSYGITGSDQIGDYQFYNTYSSSGNNYQGTVGLQPTRLFNPNFGWETNRKIEFALESGFFNDRVFLTAAWYQNRSGNQLVGVPLPGTTGFSTLNSNLDATVENSGTEFTLRTVNFTEKIKWTTTFNISNNKTKLVSFPGLKTSVYANTYEINRPLTIQKLYSFTGLNPQTGIYTFKDINNDGTLSIDDRKFIADLTPKYSGGIQNTFIYKGFVLDFLFQFVKQDGIKYLPGPAGGMANQLAEVSSQSWSTAENNTNYQAFTAGYNSALSTAYYQYASSNGAITDASYIRLKNIALNFDLPLPQSSKVKCRLIAQGQNVLTFTNFNGDPEFRFSGYLPPLKIYSVGAQLTF